MKSSLAFAIAALLAAGTALAQSDPPQPRKAPPPVAQPSGGGASTGAGEAKGEPDAGFSASIVAILTGLSAVAAASRSNETTTQH